MRDLKSGELAVLCAALVVLALLAVAVLAVASLFRFRRRSGWQKLGVVSFAWPLMPA